MTAKPLKSELHHWWPRTLSDHWSAADGMVSVIRSTGEIHRAPPGAFGAITNAHRVKLGGPWDSTFEPLFNKADQDISDIVRWLASLETPILGTDRPMLDRIGPQLLEQSRQQQLARVTASLLARSPRTRHSIKLKTEYYRREFPDPTASKTLIAANQRGLYDGYRKRMEAGGRWAILFSDEAEFVAGDGFFHNFPASTDGLHIGRKLVLPLLPTAAIIYMLPMQYPTEPRLVTLRLAAAEVARLNEIVEVYASDLLFYRSEKPVISEHFKAGKHCMYEHHGHDWLDPLLDSLSQYNLWGKDGAAGMSGRRPFTDSLEGNRRLQGFRG